MISFYNSKKKEILTIFASLITILHFIQSYYIWPSYEALPVIVIPIFILGWYYGTKYAVSFIYIYLLLSRLILFIIKSQGEDIQILLTFFQDGLSYILIGTLVAFLVGELGKVNNKLQQSVLETEKLNLELEVFNEELRATNDQLENANEELKFKNTELEIVNDLIEKEKLKKESFFSHTIHDLKSSVRSINFIINSIEKKNKSANESSRNPEEFIKRLSNTSNHLIGLTQDLLDLAKYERLEYELELSWVSSLELFAFSKNFQITVNEEGREYFETIDEEITQFKLFIDEKRYQQVINNLVNNAIKFSEKNDVIHLIINFKKLSDENILLETIVKDTGRGIRPEMQTKIFDQYYQGDNHGKSGYGLGLAIVKKIVDLMDGEIKLNSKPDEGSEFIISIPLQVEKLSVQKLQ